VDTFTVALLNAVKERHTPVSTEQRDTPFFEDTVGNVRAKEMYALLQDAIKSVSIKI
jgi:hypothetical protein